MKRVKFVVSGHFLENTWREWPGILPADISLLSLELIRFWSWSVDFPPFSVILTQWNESNLWFLGISWRLHGGNSLKFCMLLHPGHLQNWLDFGCALLIFFIMVCLWLCETGHICWSVGQVGKCSPSKQAQHDDKIKQLLEWWMTDIFNSHVIFRSK